MPTIRPTVTDEHRKKYEAIMGTAVKSNVHPSSTPTGAGTPTPTGAGTPTQIDKSPSSISLLLASLPKVKGIGNKMFIFTGKKKIIMDGTKREVEDIKTVDAKPSQTKEKEKVEEPPKKILSEKELVAKNVPIEVIESKAEVEKAPFHPKKAAPPETQAEMYARKKKLITIILVPTAILFLFGWTLFWLNFFDYIKIF